MIDIDIDSNQFDGFAGVKAVEPSRSRFTIQMHAVPRVGETIYVSQSLVPDICLKGINAPAVETEGQYAGYVALEVVVVTHRLDGQSHRPYLFCRQTRSPFAVK